MNPPVSSPDLMLESVFRTSLDGILVCRAIRDSANQIVDFQVVQCNDRAHQIAGISRETMMAKSMLTVDPDGSQSGIFDVYRQVIETGLPTHIEHYFAQNDIWMAQSLARLNDEHVLASWADISRQKRAEQARQQQTELLQAILDNMGSGIAVMESVRDEQGTVVDFRFAHLNTKAELITRRDKAILLGKRCTVAWPDSRTNGVLDWHLQVVQTAAPVTVNGVNLPVDNYDGWYNIRLRPFGDGVIVTFVDVTALKRAELAHQQQTELLRSVLDNSLNPILAFSAIRDEQTGKIIDFRYVAQNEASRKDVDRTDDEVIGHTMLEYFPHVMPTGLFERYVRVIETGEPTRFEQEYNYDKLSGWFEYSVSKWGDGMVLTLVDITSRKDHQQQLEQVNRDLLNANDNLRQFAYVASHDLQEPLRKIMAFSNILQDQFSPQLGEFGQDIISRMTLATNRMSTLIKDVLAYSRISTHRESFLPVQLDQLLTDICHTFRDELKEKDARVDMDTLPTVLGDRHQLHHLFHNLLANAIKFHNTQRPAHIRINSCLVEGTIGLPELNPAESYYEISLTDNGIGFDDKYVDRIFQVFQRLHDRQTYSGTGVGLAICKRVVENHRGAITATSLLGEGATFKVYLPKYVSR
jgi:signal transduction histidine kinase